MPETKEALPVIRANNNDINMIFGLFAAIQEMEKAKSEMYKRVKAIPGGWRDLSMMCSVMDKLVQNLCKTLPPEKLVSVQRMLPHMRYKLQCGATASQMGEDECLIAMEDLDTISRYAHEQCKMCIDQNCNRCGLGRTFDRIMTEDRDEGSWAYIDFDERMKG